MTLLWLQTCNSECRWSYRTAAIAQFTRGRMLSISGKRVRGRFERERSFRERERERERERRERERERERREREREKKREREREREGERERERERESFRRGEGLRRRPLEHKYRLFALSASALHTLITYIRTNIHTCMHALCNTHYTRTSAFPCVCAHRLAHPYSMHTVRTPRLCND